VVYLRIVFDFTTTLCTLCCHSVGNDRSHSPLSASLPTATCSFHLPPLGSFEFFSCCHQHRSFLLRVFGSSRSKSRFGFFLPAAISTVRFSLRVFGSSRSNSRIGFFFPAATSTELKYFVYSTVQKHCRTFCLLLCRICFMPVSGSPPTSLPSYSDKYVTLM